MVLYLKKRGESCLHASKDSTGKGLLTINDLPPTFNIQCLKDTYDYWYSCSDSSNLCILLHYFLNASLAKRRTGG